MKTNNFTKGVEKLINPVDVGTLHFVQSFTGSLPLSTQKKMVEKGAKTTPTMGFVVEPYSFFLGYEIKDLTKANELLPDGFKMIKTHIFDNDEPKYYGVFGVFNAHTSGFWGMRMEFYLIAENTKTGMLSWMIVDYDTNTISYDPEKGLSSPNALGSLFTVDYNGIIHADIRRNDKSKNMVFTSDITKGTMKSLDKRLWIEGNLSIGYGKTEKLNDSNVFSLKFDPKEFDQALEIKREDLNIEINDWFTDLIEEEPSKIVCFPYAQHYLSDSPGAYSQLKDKEELLEEIEKVDFSKINVFSTKPFKKMIVGGAILSVIVNITLLVLLII